MRILPPPPPPWRPPCAPSRAAGFLLTTLGRSNEITPFPLSNKPNMLTFPTPFAAKSGTLHLHRTSAFRLAFQLSLFPLRLPLPPKKRRANLRSGGMQRVSRRPPQNFRSGFAGTRGSAGRRARRRLQLQTLPETPWRSSVPSEDDFREHLRLPTKGREEGPLLRSKVRKLISKK